MLRAGSRCTLHELFLSCENLRLKMRVSIRKKWYVLNCIVEMHLVSKTSFFLCWRKKLLDLTAPRCIGIISKVSEEDFRVWGKEIKIPFWEPLLGCELASCCRRRRQIYTTIVAFLRERPKSEIIQIQFSFFLFI